MKYNSKTELLLISIMTLLCLVIVYNFLRKLRSNFPYRVNCWFCNYNFWIRFPNRNCWTCKNCEQYNGFTKDGDYNKPLITTAEVSFKTPKCSRRSKNGLCKMCNINQQLKVAQLANFVPMNENNFDEEIDNYRLKLDKAYKLCSPCKKVLQAKLHKEKETILGSKLVQTRSPQKRNVKTNSYNLFKGAVNGTGVMVAAILFLLTSIELYKVLMNNCIVSSNVHQITNIITNIIQRSFSIVKMKAFLMFPVLKEYANYFNELTEDATEYGGLFNSHNINFNEATDVAEKALGGVGCTLQILGHIFDINTLSYAMISEFLWFTYLFLSLGHDSLSLDPLLVCLIKIFCTVMVYVLHVSSRANKNISPVPSTPKRMKNLVNGSKCDIADEDTSSFETDDDVSLSKYGIHSFTDSSNEVPNMFNSTLVNGRAFTPRSNDSIWDKSRLNSTFSANSMHSKSPSVITENVFLKPTFSNYQKLNKDDSDSDLDECISYLSLGSPKKASVKSKSDFSVHKFAPSPSFLAPSITPLNPGRPLISPSKLGHTTSWVAGGYWGSDGNRQVFNVNGSRSSSQSSGFESQTSSLNHKHLFSQPSSREESVCGEVDRNVLLDRFRNCNMNGYANDICQNPHSFSVHSPTFPQMRYDSHVYIPQPRFVSQNMFLAHGSQQTNPYVRNNMFKTPGGTGLIKLPQSSFSPQ